MATLNNVITNANGCVGIGTSSPAQLLELKKTTGSAIALLNYNDSVKFNINASSGGAGYVGMVTNHDLIFVTNDTERARLNTNGNLGIGTSSPAYKLDVVGSVYSSNYFSVLTAATYGPSDNSAAMQVFGSTGSGGLTNTIKFLTGGSERVRIDSSGNVGIGTSSPVSKLHLDDATAPYITITRTGVPTWQLRNNFPVNQYGFSFNNTTAGTTPLFIGAGGNIGIGTSGPTNRLDVVGGSGTTFNMSNDGDSQRGGKLTFISSSATGRQFYVGTTSAIYNLVFGIDSVEKARIDTAGNVGINTTSPSAKLHVSASASTTAGIFQGVVGIGLTPTSAVPRLQIYGTSTTNAESRLAIYTSNTGTAFNNGLQLAVASDSVTSLINYSNTALYFGTNSTERMRIASDGNVGIGTTSVSANLVVGYNGTVHYEEPGATNVLIKGKTSNSRALLEIHDSNGTVKSYFQSVYSTGLAYIGTYSNHGLVWTTGGTEKVRLDTNGNVGIGTSSPSALLNAYRNSNTTAPIGYFQEVYGSPAKTNVVLVERLNNLSNTNVSASSAGVRIRDHSNNYALSVEDHIGNSYMVVKGGGNVGIGTNNPKNKLHVAGLMTLDSTIVYSKVNTVTTNNPIRITIPFTKINTGADFIVKVKAVAMADNSSGANYLDYVGYSGYTFNFNANLTTIEKYGNVTVNSYVSASSGTVGNLYVELDGVDGFTQNSNWTIQTDIMANSRYATFDSGSITTLATSISEDSLETSFNKYFGGNVGIGTTTVPLKLNVNGSVYMSAGNGTAISWANDLSSQFLKYDSGIDGMILSGWNNVTFYTQQTERVRINSTGNVGIGTSSPSSILHVRNSNAGDQTLLVLEHSAGYSVGTENRLDFYDDEVHKVAARISQYYTGEAGNRWGLKFYTNSSTAINSTPALTLMGNNNVGIGTTAPATKLDVKGNVFVANAANGNNIIAFGNIGTLGPLNGAPNNLTGSAFLVVSSSTASGAPSNMRFFTTTGGTCGERMRIAADGNVGIGTSTLFAKFVVSNGSGENIEFTPGNATVNGGLIENINRSTGTTRPDLNLFTSNASNGSIKFYTNGVNERMRVASDGNVGIGTTAPAYKLEVNGSLYATRLSGSAMFTTNGKGRFYGTASYALAAPGGSSLTGQTDSVTPFETSLGHQAGNSNTGTGNTAIGYQALFSNTTGTGSIAIGYQALYSNTRGKRNIAIGYEALRTTQGSTDGFGDPIGDENVAIGYQAARAAFNINRVVAIGHRALAKNLAGGNVAIGWLAMESNVGTANSNLGILNTAVGTMALSSNTSGNANSAFGYLALNANTTGNENTAVGHRSMLYNTTGKNNCSFGSYALYYNQIANNNSAFGAFALYSNTTNNNSAFGYKALRYNTTGVNNDAFGYQALYSNISGKGNSAFGFQALKYTTTATGNSAFGRSALTQCSGGGRNSAFGYYSSGAITGNPAFGGSGMDNCSFGYRSLRFNNSGNNNTAVGKDALYNNKVSNQTAIGYNALLGSTTGNGGNTAVGSNAGSAITFGYRNTMIGNNAGATGAAPLTTGQNNTCLGNGAITSTATVSNEITLGDSNITSLRCNRTTITSLSDFRDKTDINNVQVGLSFVEKLRPVTFKWDKREWYTDGNRDGSKKDTITQIGFIAQELKALQESENATYLNLVYESNPDKLEATPGNLMIPLIKAVQELNAIVKQQRVEFDDKISKQQLEIDYLKSKLNN